MLLRLSFGSGRFLNRVVYLQEHHAQIFKRESLTSEWQGMIFIFCLMYCAVYWIFLGGIDWNLSLHHEKTTELLGDCCCIFISIQAMHMLGYASVRGLACALQHSVSVPALLLLVYLPYSREEERSIRRKPLWGTMPWSLHSFQTGIFFLHQRTFEFVKGDTNFNQLLDVVSIYSSYFSWQVIWKWVEV